MSKEKTQLDAERHGSEENAGEVIDGETGTVEPTQGAFGKGGRRIDLSNLRDVRIELARLYRMVDAEEIKSADGSRRAYILKTVQDVIVNAELEGRLQELEDRAGIVSRMRAQPASRRLN